MKKNTLVTYFFEKIFDNLLFLFTNFGNNCIIAMPCSNTRHIKFNEKR